MEVARTLATDSVPDAGCSPELDKRGKKRLAALRIPIPHVCFPQRLCHDDRCQPGIFVCVVRCYGAVLQPRPPSPTSCNALQPEGGELDLNPEGSLQCKPFTLQTKVPERGGGKLAGPARAHLSLNLFKQRRRDPRAFQEQRRVFLAILFAQTPPATSRQLQRYYFFSPLSFPCPFFAGPDGVVLLVGMSALSKGDLLSFLIAFSGLTPSIRTEFHHEADANEVLLIDMDSLLGWALDNASLSAQYGGISFLSVFFQCERLFKLLHDRQIRFQCAVFDVFDTAGRRAVDLKAVAPETLRELRIPESVALIEEFLSVQRDADLQELQSALVDEQDAGEEAGGAAEAEVVEEEATTAGSDHEGEEAMARPGEKPSAELEAKKTKDLGTVPGGHTVAMELAQQLEEVVLAGVPTPSLVQDGQQALFSYLLAFPYQYLLLRRLLVDHLRRIGVHSLRFSSWYSAEFRQHCRNTRPFAVLLDLRYNLTASASSRQRHVTVFDLFAISCVFERLRFVDIHTLSWVASSVYFQSFSLQQEAAMLSWTERLHISSATIASLTEHLFFPPAIDWKTSLPSSVSVDPLPKDVDSTLKLVMHSCSSLAACRPLMQALAVCSFVQRNVPLDMRLTELPAISLESNPKHAAIVLCARVVLEEFAKAASPVLQSLSSSTKMDDPAADIVLDLIDPRFFVAVCLALADLPAGSMFSDLFSVSEEAMVKTEVGCVPGHASVPNKKTVGAVVPEDEEEVADWETLADEDDGDGAARWSKSAPVDDWESLADNEPADVVAAPTAATAVAALHVLSSAEEGWKRRFIRFLEEVLPAGSSTTILLPTVEPTALLEHMRMMGAVLEMSSFVAIGQSPSAADRESVLALYEDAERVPVEGDVLRASLREARAIAPELLSTVPREQRRGLEAGLEAPWAPSREMFPHLSSFSEESIFQDTRIEAKMDPKTRADPKLYALFVKRSKRRQAQELSRLDDYAKNLHGDKTRKTVRLAEFLAKAKVQEAENLRKALREEIEDMAAFRQRHEQLKRKLNESESKRQTMERAKGKGSHPGAKAKAPSKKDLIIAENQRRMQEKEASKLAQKLEAFGESNVVVDEDIEATKKIVREAEVALSAEADNKTFFDERYVDYWKWTPTQSSDSQEDVLRVQSSVLRLNRAFVSMMGRGNHRNMDVLNSRTFRTLRVVVSSFADGSAGSIEEDGELPMVPLNDAQQQMVAEICDKRNLGFIPDLWQMRMMEAIIANMSSLVVAPTSSGKTFGAYIAMERVLREDDKSRIVFVSPSEPLANQTYAEVFGMLQLPELQSQTPMIGFMTEKKQLNPTARILVVTFDVFNRLILSPDDRGLRRNLRFVIFDEIHNISDPQEGNVWAQNLQLIDCPFVALSATVGNVDDIYQWLKSLHPSKPMCLIQSFERVTDLFYGTLFRSEGDLVMKTFHPMCYADPNVTLDNVDRYPSMAPRHVMAMYQHVGAALASVKNSEAHRILTTHFNPLHKECPYFDRTKFPILTRMLMRKYDANLRDFLAWTVTLDDAHRRALSTAIQSLRKADGFDEVLQRVDRDTVSTDLQVSLNYETHPLFMMYQTLKKRQGLPAIVFDFNRPRCDASKRNLLVMVEVDAVVRQFVNPISDQWNNLESVNRLLVKFLETMQFKTPSHDDAYQFYADNAAHMQFILHTWRERILRLSAERQTMVEWSDRLSVIQLELEALEHETNEEKANEAKRPLEREATQLSKKMLEAEGRFNLSVVELFKSVLSHFGGPAESTRFLRFVGLCFVRTAVIEEERMLSKRFWEVNKETTLMFRHGIAAHHGHSTVKNIAVDIESAFRAGKMQVVFSTGLLAQGINMPCRSSVFFGSNTEYLFPTLFQQCAGRAGRRGFAESFGYVLFFGTPSHHQDRFVRAVHPLLHARFALTPLDVLRFSLKFSAALGAPALQDSIVRVLQQPFMEERRTAVTQLLFHVDALRRLQLLTPDCNPGFFASLVLNLNATMSKQLGSHSSPLFLRHLLRNGRMLEGQPLSRVSDLLAHVVAPFMNPRIVARGPPFQETAFQPVRNKVVSEDLEEFTQDVLRIWSRFGLSLANGKTHPAESFSLPFSKHALSCAGLDGSSVVRGLLLPTSRAYVVRVRSLGSALGAGLVDAFSDADDLFLHHALREHQFDWEMLPLPSKKFLQNSYVLDYYANRSLADLAVRNKFYIGEAGKVIVDVTKDLKSLARSLENAFGQGRLGDVGKSKLETLLANLDLIHVALSFDGHGARTKPPSPGETS